jgi:hypothetical protein
VGTLLFRRRFEGCLVAEEEKEDWMKRAIFLATLVLVLMLVLAPVALAQSPTATPSPAPLPGSGGPSIALPAAALLLGSGVLTYAILRRR